MTNYLSKMGLKSSSTAFKVHDECSLQLQTASYYESQHNDLEAIRSLRSVYFQLQGFNTSRANSSGTFAWRAPSEAEKQMEQKLVEMEHSTKERLDLLEAIRMSKMDNGPALQDSSGVEGLPPPVPVRPHGGDRKASGSSATNVSRPSLPLGSQSTGALGITPGTTGKGSPRSQSPDKKSFLTTLRKGDQKKKVNKRTPVEAASKAAASAWVKRDARLPFPSPGLERPENEYSTGDEAAFSTAPVPTGPPAPPPHVPSYIAYTPPVRNSMPPTIAMPDRRSHLPYPDTPPMQRHSMERLSERPVERLSERPLERPSDRPVEMSIRPKIFIDDTTRHVPSVPSAPSAPPPAVPSPAKKGSLKNGTMRPSRKPIPSDQRNTPFSPARPPKVDHRSRAETSSSDDGRRRRNRAPIPPPPQRRKSTTPSSSSLSMSSIDGESDGEPSFQTKTATILSNLPAGVDRLAAAQILHEVLLDSHPVQWTDIAGLAAAKQALKEAVVYPFLRPDLFRGLREPARGVLLFGPPGTGKTMLARAVATESGATFFSISASSLLSKWLGDSERLVRALFALAKAMAPSVVFVDEIDSLLSSRDGDSSGGGGNGIGAGKNENEATRRVKTEFLIQWSALSEPISNAKRGSKVGNFVSKKQSQSEPAEVGSTSSPTAGAVAGAVAASQKDLPPAAPQVLILAATNTPWALDPAARRRFVRRTYIPLPDIDTRRAHVASLMESQGCPLLYKDLEELAQSLDGYSGSDIAALARDAALAPLRELGEDALLSVDVNEIRNVNKMDWLSGMERVRASVGKDSIARYDEWATEWGERGA